MIVSMMLLGPVDATAQAGVVQLNLRPQVLADNADWLLIDAVDGPPALHDTLHLDQVRISAPQPGQVDRWSPAQIERLLRARADGVLPPFRWAGADHVVVTRRVQAVAAETFVAVAIAAWTDARPGLQKDLIELARPLPPIDIASGSYRLRSRPVVQPDRTDVVVWVDVLVNDKVVRSVNVRLCNRAVAARLTAKRFLSAGQYVTTADFEKVETTDTASDATGALASAAHPVRLRHALRQGETLTVAALEPAEAIRRGDAVRLVTRTGGITLETNGVAADDAQPGQPVAVLRGDGRDLVRGRVFEGHRVEIE
jgi:flagella basal body P-ring formation protein FlgA